MRNTPISCICIALDSPFSHRYIYFYKERPCRLSFFVGYICLLCAFFVAIVKLLKTNRICKTTYNLYKMLIYSIIIV